MPTLVIMLAVTIYPFLFSLYLSFHKWDLSAGMAAPIEFVGFKNYLSVLTDPAFWKIMQNTVFFVTVAVGLEFSIGLGLALLLDRDIPGIRVYRLLCALPVMMTPILMGILWTYMYKEDFGIINYFLSLVGVGKVAWQGDPTIAMFACIFVDVWQWTPFMMLVILAGLKSLPAAPFEAASIDGANRWQIFRKLTLPFLKPVIAVSLAIRIMDAFRVFDVIWQLTQGGPGQATETIAIYIYRQSFRYFHMGLGAAASYIALIVVAIVCTIIIRSLHEVIEI